MTRCAPEHAIGTTCTPALIAIIAAPFLKACNRPSGLRVPSGYIKNDWPPRSATVALSTLAIADSRDLRSTGIKCADKNAPPTIGQRNSDSFKRIAMRRGMAPTTAGASTVLVDRKSVV